MFRSGPNDAKDEKINKINKIDRIESVWRDRSINLYSPGRNCVDDDCLT